MSDTLPVHSLFGVVENILSIKAQQNPKRILLSNAKALSRGLTGPYLSVKQKFVMFAIKACKGWSERAESVSNMILNNTDPSDLSTLDDQSLQTLIDHYLRVRENLPDNLRVRDRLVELQQELLNRKPVSTIEGMSRQTTENKL
jgi:hypothetical protein